MDFFSHVKVSHYNFVWGAGAGWLVSGLVTDNYWWRALIAVAGAVLGYATTFWGSEKSSVPTVREWLDSLRDRAK